MTAHVIALAPIREAKRDAELRERFGVEPNQTSLPIGLLAQQLLDGVRLRLAAERNTKAHS